jgi:hypothetical protein
VSPVRAAGSCSSSKHIAVTIRTSRYRVHRQFQHRGNRTFAPPNSLRTEADGGYVPAQGEVVTRRVREGGRISLDGFDYLRRRLPRRRDCRCGRQAQRSGLGFATAASSSPATRDAGGLQGQPNACSAHRARPTGWRGVSHQRTVDPKGAISFAGGTYAVAKRLSGQQVEVRIARGKVRVSKDGELLCTHAIRHDRSKELGAFAIPKGRPRSRTTAQKSVEISVAEQLKPMRSTGTEP